MFFENKLQRHATTFKFVRLFGKAFKAGMMISFKWSHWLDLLKLTCYSTYIMILQ